MVVIMVIFHFYDMRLSNYYNYFVYNEHLLILEESNRGQNMHDFFKESPRPVSIQPEPQVTLGFSLYLTQLACAHVGLILRVSKY